MRLAAYAFLALSLCACGTSLGRTLIGGTCDEQYRQCRQQPGDNSVCGGQRRSCALAQADHAARQTEKQRGFEEFLQNREDD